ncbi:MAG TPA: hypothetical protein VEI04_13775 [Syntrophobacteria bacterium]|jgi:hypothetical protein|nr:hypothetical protein [Syntrophobacteria bacterium]
MEEPKQSVVRTWALIVLLAIWFLAYSAFVYFAIGEKGPPNWDLVTVSDTPASSPYAIYQPLPYPQHVRGERGH